MNQVTPLRCPLKQYLADPVTSEARLRVEKQLFARLADGLLAEGPLAEGPIPAEEMRGSRAWILGPLALALALALVACVLWWGKDRGPLLTEGGGELTLLESERSALRVRFADGSQIVARPDTRVVGLLSTSDQFAVSLERGMIDLQVTPGGPRKWTVETALGQVQVVGTKFSVDVRRGRLQVAVREGVVLVRSTLLETPVVRLAAGESVEVAGSGKQSAAAEPPPSSPSRAGQEPLSAVPKAPPEPQGPRALQLNELPEEKLADAARSDSNARGASEVVSELRFEALRAQADLARSEGRLRDAVRLYETLVDAFPQEPRLPMVLFQYGTTVARAGAGSRANALFERALALGPSRSLNEDLLLRLVEGHLAQGDPPGARAYADRYAREFPNGRHHQSINRLIESGPR